MIGADTALKCGPSEDTDTLADLKAGDAFAMLDNSLGWAWGYAGAERLVGYVPAEAVAS